MAGRDPFLNLPDGLICSHILNKLPLKEAIRCSAVSRRWKRFWTLLPTLSFTKEFFSSIPATIVERKKRKVSQIELVGNTFGSIIDNILLLHSESIEVFELCNAYWCRDKIRQWILSVASKGVTEITLEEKSSCSCGYHPIEVPYALFSCDKLVYLSLKGFKLPPKLAHFGGLQCLKVFHIENVVLNEVAFDLLVNLCPLLETMSVLNCRVIKNLKLDSESLKTLHLKVLDVKSSSSMIVNCPQLTELELKINDAFYGRTMLAASDDDETDLEANDDVETKLEGTIRVNCPQLTQLQLQIGKHFDTKLEANCPLLVRLITNNSRVLHGIPILDSLRKLSLLNPDGVNIFSKFPNIEELCISSLDGLPRALKLKESKLKKLHILNHPSANVGVLFHLLRRTRTPSLETVTISLDMGFRSVDDLRFVNALLSRMSRSAKVILSDPQVTCPNCQVLFKKMHSCRWWLD